MAQEKTQSPSPSSQQFKIVLLGEGRVGKTCVCLRYVEGSFSDNQESTITATFLEKRINVGKTSVKLMIWDTAGQERFHALGPIYYRDANGALLVYDITDRESFTKVRHWVKELRKIVGKDIVLVIAGNKSDMEKNRQVNDVEAKEYADSVGAVHIMCSAKTGKGVENAFLELTKEILKSQQKAAADGRAVPAAKDKRTFVDISNETEVPKKSCC